MTTKQKLFHLTNLSLLIGAALVGYSWYASSQHTMTWAKLAWFWIGCLAIAIFLIYHLVARSTAFWQGRPVRRYSLLHRALCVLLLGLGLLTAAKFSYRTWQDWQLPAVYWETLGVEKNELDHVAVRLALGNQRYHHAVALQEIQLLALHDLPPRTKPPAVNLQIDSVRLPLQREPGRIPYFDLKVSALLIPPLAQRELRFNFRPPETLAIFQLNALYQEKSDEALQSQKLASYILFERREAALIEFAELAARAAQPSRGEQGNFIHAVGRSRHPLALGTLLELLKVHDVRIQNAVCEALAMLGDPRAAPALIAVAQKTRNPQAVRALGELPDKTSFDFLIGILEGEQEAFLRAEAVEALGRLAILPNPKFDRAIPTLISILSFSSSEDALVQREAMLALARISDSLAVPILLDYAKHHHSGQALRNLLDATTILGDDWLLPSLGIWIQDWRGYNLDFTDLQLLLNYLVVTRHRDMVQVLIETLELELSPEAQAQIVDALYQLTGNDFGELQHPVLNLATERSNRQILKQWQRWWKQAQQDSLFREQVKPIG